MFWNQRTRKALESELEGVSSRACMGAFQLQHHVALSSKTHTYTVKISAQSETRKSISFNLQDLITDQQTDNATWQTKSKLAVPKPLMVLIL